jgi:probable phosphoglycerate mutase
MMTTLLLIRHGMTDAVGRVITGRRPGVHLNEEGKRQVELLVETLSTTALAAVYSSPLERALETARPIARAHVIEPQLSDRLLEVDFGQWEGCTLDELSRLPEWQAFNEFRSHTHAPGGEHMLDVQRRMIDEMEELRRRHAGECVAVVSHGDVIRATVAHYLGVPLDLFLRLEISPASVSAIQLGEMHARVPIINGTAPLLAPLQF